ncbi:unnamed protein product, partial [Laminaria digitata]
TQPLLLSQPLPKAFSSSLAMSPQPRDPCSTSIQVGRWGRLERVALRRGGARRLPPAPLPRPPVLRHSSIQRAQHHHQHHHQQQLYLSYEYNTRSEYTYGEKKLLASCCCS